MRKRRVLTPLKDIEHAQDDEKQEVLVLNRETKKRNVQTYSNIKVTSIANFDQAMEDLSGKKIRSINLSAELLTVQQIQRPAEKSVEQMEILSVQKDTAQISNRVQEVFDCKFQPRSIRFRDEQYQEIKTFITTCMNGEQDLRCLLITGLPGCGKTLIVNRLLDQISVQQLNIYRFNAINFKKPGDFIEALYKNFCDKDEKATQNDKLRAIKDFLRSKSDENSNTLILIDEFDNLFNGNQVESLDIFSIAKNEFQTTIIGISNYIEMLINMKEKNQIFLPHIKNVVFKQYTSQQLNEIIKERITEIYKMIEKNDIKIIDDLGIKLCSGRVFNNKGSDLRCLFEVCKKALMNRNIDDIQISTECLIQDFQKVAQKLLLLKQDVQNPQDEPSHDENEGKGAQNTVKDSMEILKPSNQPKNDRKPSLDESIKSSNPSPLFSEEKKHQQQTKVKNSETADDDSDDTESSANDKKQQDRLTDTVGENSNSQAISNLSTEFSSPVKSKYSQEEEYEDGTETKDKVDAANVSRETLSKQMEIAFKTPISCKEMSQLTEDMCSKNKFTSIIEGLPFTQQLMLFSIYQICNTDKGIIEITAVKIMEFYNRLATTFGVPQYKMSLNSIEDTIQTLGSYNLLQIRKQHAKRGKSFVGSNTKIIPVTTNTEIGNALQNHPLFEQHI